MEHFSLEAISMHMDDKNTTRRVSMDSQKANHAWPTWSHSEEATTWMSEGGTVDIVNFSKASDTVMKSSQANSRSVHWMTGLRTGWTADSGAHHQLLAFIWMAKAGHKVTDTQQSCWHQHQKFLSPSVSALYIISTSLLQRAHIQPLA